MSTVSQGSEEGGVFGAIGFLNEVMGRHPDAISFAPGAPLLEGITRERVIAALDEGAALAGAGPGWERLFTYGPSQGVINDALAAALSATAGLDVSPSDLTVTVGAQEAFILLLRALDLHRTGTLGIVAPAFAGIRGAAAFLGVRAVDVLEGPAGVCADAVRAACAQATAEGAPLRALYVAPDHSNPSGVVLDHPARLALLAVAEEQDLLLVEDTTYGFTDPGVPASLKALDTARRVVQVGTFSKVCLPGARVGYVVADQPWGEGSLATWMATLKNMTTVNTSPLTQAVVAGLVLADPDDLRRRGRALAEVYREKRLALLAALDEELPDAAALGLSWNRPTGGFFVVLSTPHDLDHAAVEDCAVRYGVLWTPMRDFHAGAEGDRQLRLSCSFAPTDQIREGVRRLGAFLRERPLEAR